MDASRAPVGPREGASVTRWVSSAAEAAPITSG